MNEFDTNQEPSHPQHPEVVDPLEVLPATIQAVREIFSQIDSLTALSDLRSTSDGDWETRTAEPRNADSPIDRIVFYERFDDHESWPVRAEISWRGAASREDNSTHWQVRGQNGQLSFAKLPPGSAKHFREEYELGLHDVSQAEAEGLVHLLNATEWEVDS